MLIEKICPDAVGEKSSVKIFLISELKKIGFSDEDVVSFVSAIPSNLLNAEAFFDKRTNRWRYEFGLPLTLNETRKFAWGVHMWPEAHILFKVILCCCLKVQETERENYVKRLADQNKHGDVLSEMKAVMRVDPKIGTEFEVSGFGADRKKIDWKIGPVEGRLILLEVKVVSQI